MGITRRNLLAGTGAAATMLALPDWCLAEIGIGDATVQTVSDGHLTLPAGFVFEPVPDDIGDKVRADFGLTGDTLTPPCNLTLVRRDEAVILFDAGSGGGFQPTAGQLVDALDAVGLAPEDVTHVVFTHGHPDHLWGVLDDFDEPVFHEAEHMIGRAEFDYWSDPATVDSIGTARQSFAAGAARRLDMLADRLSFIEDDAEILPGISSVLTPGHTPGHMAFVVHGGSQSLMIVGDAIANHHMALAHPAIPLGSDQDMETAAQTRVRLVERLADEGMALAGFHLPDGGIGRIDRHGDGFVFLPETE